MKKNTTAMLMALALGFSSLAVLAQQSDNQTPGDGPPPQGGPPEGGLGDGTRPARRPRPPLEAALDANGDGVIDSNEIANASAALKTLDKNNDGQLTPNEYRPKRPHGGFGGPPGGGPDQGQGGPPPGGSDQGPGGPPSGGPDKAGQGQGQQPSGGPEQGGIRPPRPPLEAALDVNGDGIIDADEIANASEELKTLDKNNDGQLTPNEYRPKRPHGRGFGGPDQGGPDQGQEQQPPPDDGMQPPPGPPPQDQ